MLRKHDRFKKRDLNSILQSATPFFLSLSSLDTRWHCIALSASPLFLSTTHVASCAVVPFPCVVLCYCFCACLLIGRACRVCRIWFDRVRAKQHQILNTRQARPISKQAQKTITQNVTRKWHDWCTAL